MIRYTRHNVKNSVNIDSRSYEVIIPYYASVPKYMLEWHGVRNELINGKNTRSAYNMETTVYRSVREILKLYSDRVPLRFIDQETAYKVYLKIEEFLNEGEKLHINRADGTEFILNMDELSASLFNGNIDYISDITEKEAISRNTMHGYTIIGKKATYGGRPTNIPLNSNLKLKDVNKEIRYKDYHSK